MKRVKKSLAIVLTMAMIVTLLPLSSYDSFAAKKTKISKKKITLVVGQKKKLKFKHKPKGVKVKWKSKNKKIAKVSKKGKVTALRVGKTKIIAKVGKKKYKCKVFVKAKGTVIPTKKTEPTAAPVTTVAPTEPEITVAPTTVRPTVAPTTAKPTVAPTTKAPTTAKPTTVAPTTVAPTQPQGATLPDIVGLVYAGKEALPHYFAWAASTGVDGYYVYIGKNKVETVMVSCVNLSPSYFPTSGTYIIGVQAFKGNEFSNIATVEYIVNNGSNPTQAPTTAKPTVVPTTKTPTTAVPTQKPTVAPTTQNQQPTQASDFELDESLQKPFGIVIENPDPGIIQVVWGAGEPNCYNVYVDGTRKKTKVPASVQRIPVQTDGRHVVAIATVSGKKESIRTEVEIIVSGTAQEEVETTALPADQMPQIDESIQKENGKMILQLNNKTNGQYADNQIYWIIVGRNPQNHKMAYLTADGNLVEASSADNDGNINGRNYSAKIVHTLAQKKAVQLPAIESGRMYLSYGAPVYITFNGEGQNVGYAGPDVNNTGDANYNTLFEYLEFTTEAVNGGITFHGNVTRVDFFSFPMIARLTDEYGSYDRCVGDMKSRSETFELYRNTVSNPFKTLIDDKRIMSPAKKTFGEGQQYGNYYDDYINRFWSKYANEDLVIGSEAGNFRGRVQNGRLVLSNSSGTYYIDKPSTQDVLEGRGAFNRISEENKNNSNGIRCELAIEAQLCAAFTRGVALTPENWSKPDTYYKSGEVCNEYAAFFHPISVSNRAYGFCYDDVFDQSTLVECGNAERFTIDLKW